MAGSSWDWNLVPCLCRGQLVSAPCSPPSERLTLIFFHSNRSHRKVWAIQIYKKVWFFKNHVLGGLLLSKLVVERQRYHCVGMSNVPGAPNRILCGRPSHVEAVCSMMGEKINGMLHTTKGLVVGLFYLKIFIPVWDSLSCGLNSRARSGAFWVGSFSWGALTSEYLNLALLPLQTVLGKLSSYLPFSVLICKNTVTLLLCIASKDIMRIC